MFAEIKERTKTLQTNAPSHFASGTVNFQDVPDAHSVAIVCSHLGRPLYSLIPGPYSVHGTRPQVNGEPLERYKLSINNLLLTIV